jgi:hypothetical protein
MMCEIIAFARAGGLHMIGLSVVADNKWGNLSISKIWLQIEGFKKEAYFGEDGKFHAELMMGLILG